MRIHALIHAPFEKLGIIEQWIAQHQHPLTTTHTYRGEALPAVNQFDFLIIMGGPQSPLQLEEYPYLRNEMMLTAETIRAHKPILGICLGAQIIGQALGANTEQSPQREIGVYPIQLTPAAAQDPVFAHFPAEFDVMHWHNNMPGLPTDSVLLASSAGCPRQAFRYDDRVYGLQFHSVL